MENQMLTPNDNWQTQQRGTNDQEYQIAQEGKLDISDLIPDGPDSWVD